MQVEVYRKISGSGRGSARQFPSQGGEHACPCFGLGLSIAKTLVDGMGGEIVMESELGRGAL
jgi:K+-sensing histidine kinase KdpD